MARLLALLAISACVLVAGCGGNDTTAPSTPPVIFSALLSPANEVPPVSGSESAGHGAAQIQFDVTRDAGGAITSATATFYFQLTGFSGGTTLIADDGLL